MKKKIKMYDKMKNKNLNSVHLRDCIVVLFDAQLQPSKRNHILVHNIL